MFDSIAIVGLGCRFPYANNPRNYWKLLEDGVDAVTEIPTDRWDSSSYYDKSPAKPGKMNTRWGGFLEEIDKFDADFFRISPREAQHIDPQHRLLLEVSWEALENAGLVPEELANSKTGVFIGISNNDYGRYSFQDSSKITAYSGIGNALCIAANRLSYYLNLKGPSLSIDTACSSSLVAVHYACQSLRLKESDLCLVGGVNLILAPELTISFSQARMMSLEGRCKTFDASGDGFVRGEGCGVVVLKRLSEAVKDGNFIYAVIRGSAINQDGLTNGLTAPNGPSQQAVVRQALTNAGLSANEISYVEAHGTGTPLGDPQEFNSLKKVLMENRGLDKPCWIGSVKTNIGHLESAAGIAGLMKVVLCLHHKKITPHLHLQKLNPYISLNNTPLKIPQKCEHWNTPSDKRFAGISGFGFGGTNCHVIVEEAPQTREAEASKETNPTERPYHLLTLSAKTEPALLEMASLYQTFLANNPDISVADICFSANVGRSNFDHRLAIVGTTSHNFQQQLAAFGDQIETTSIAGKLEARKPPKIAFLFTGQGSQYVNMGKQLYETQPSFRKTIDHCDQILKAYLDQSILEVIYSQNEQNPLIDETSYTQTALFTIEYALAQLWRSWGIEPDVVMGHSVGEYVAACIAGVFSLEDGLKLIAHRGRLMQELPSGGKMIALMASESQVKQLIAPYNNRICIAAINGPKSVVVSGEGEVIDLLIPILESEKIKTKRLQVSHAFHSCLMEPMLADFEAVASQVNYTTPSISIVSNLTGELIEENIATAEYWVNHIRQPVKFAQGMQTLHQKGYKIFLEVGPKPILLGMGRECLPEDVGTWLPSLRNLKTDWQQILESLGQLYIQGTKINWIGFEKDYSPHQVELPTYPFQRQQFWLEIQNKDTRFKLDNIEDLQDNLEQTGELSEAEVKLLPKLLELLVQQQQQSQGSTIEDLLYEIQWKLQPRIIETKEKKVESGKWVIFSDRQGLGEKIFNKLTIAGCECHLVFIGENYQHEDKISYINPNQKEDLQKLWQDLSISPDCSLKGVIHLWALDLTSTENLDLNSLQEAQILTCASVLYSLQTLEKLSLEVPPKLWLVTQGVQKIASQTVPLSIAQSCLWGMGKVVSLELPDWWGGMIDLDINTSEYAVDNLLLEIENSQGENQISFRQDKRYVPRLVRKRTPTNSKTISFSSDKTYLITGGLGALGLQVAQWMVEKGVRNLVLISRQPPSNEVSEILSQMREKGVKVKIMSGNVADEMEMREVFDSLDSEMPPLKGIIHAAGTIEDGILLEQNWQQFRKVLSSKVEGTWNLHKLTQNKSLDFCIFFSSISSLFGSPGQSNYAAANQFMDSLAHYRCQTGQPTLSINWSPWDSGGMATKLKEFRQTQLKKQGINFISLEKGLKALGRLITVNQGAVGVLSIDWDTFSKYLSKQSVSFFLEVIPYLDTISHNENRGELLKKDWLNQLKSVVPEDRLRFIRDYLQQIVSQALRLTPERVMIDQPINMMGLDSLIAIELRNQIRKELNLEIPIAQLMEDSSIASLAVYLKDKFNENLLSNKIASPLQEKVEKTPSLDQTSSDSPQMDNDDWIEGEL